jgi:hypothetical protein
VFFLASFVAVVTLASPATAQDANVTRAEAERTARDFVEGQASIEDPPVRSIDDATFREFRGRGETTLGQDTRIEDRSVYVPQQSGFPKVFLAVERAVTNGSAAGRQLLLFVKAAEGAPWKITMAAGLTGRFPKLRTDSDGFTRLINGDTASRLALSKDTLASKLAKLWDSGKSTSKTFAPGPLTTGALDTFIQDLSSRGITASVNFKFAKTDDAPVCFEIKARGALCLSVISMKQRLKPTKGSGAFVQPQSREPLTGLIVPGEYDEIRYDNLAIVAANIPAKGKGRVTVIGSYTGMTNAEADATTPSDAV